MDTAINPYPNMAIKVKKARGVTVTGMEIAVGDVLGKVTATEKYVIVDSTAVDGSAIARCVALEACDATLEDMTIPALFEGKVNGDELSFGGTDSLATHLEHLRDAGLQIVTHMDP